MVWRRSFTVIFEERWHTFIAVILMTFAVNSALFLFQVTVYHFKNGRQFTTVDFNVPGDNFFIVSKGDAVQLQDRMLFTVDLCSRRQSLVSKGGSFVPSLFDVGI